MIRALFLLLVLAAGLAAAALFQGQMHHARQAVPKALPGWSEAVAPNAGLRQGMAELPASGRWPATRLEWTARAPDADGWVWDVSLTGKGIALEGHVTLGFLAESVTVSNVRGSIDLGVVAGLPIDVQGIARLVAGQVNVTDLRGSPVVSATVGAQLAAFRMDGADFGEGPLIAELEEGGIWRAKLDLSGGVSPLQAALTGALADPVAQLEATFDDGPALPPTMRAMLAAAGQADGQAWRLSVAVPVP